jgi:mono/diheme cytochrome c family protein
MAGFRDRHFPSLGFVAVAVLLLVGLGAAFVYSGLYEIGADVPHSAAVSWTIEQLRDRAIAHHARNIAPPADLGDPKRIAAGAGLYSEMCSQCHLAPGMAKTEISQGLYPAPPELVGSTDLTPGQRFWIVKHGVKLTAMPAWGRTHDDVLIWDLAAFLGKLPSLSPAQYRALVKSAPQDHDEMMREMPPVAH